MLLSRHLAVALTNCDFSGLNEEDMENINKIDFDFYVVNWNEESSDINGRCFISGLYDHCVEIEIVDR